MAFCHKCGTKADDNTMVCGNCGEKLLFDEPVQQADETKTIKSLQPQINNIPTNIPKKKKSKIIPIIIGIAVLIIIFVIAAASFSGNNTDYIATVKAHKPFAVSQNLPFTYSEVFDKYIIAPVWEVRKSNDNIAYVDVSGTAKGTKNDLVITIKVAPNPNDVNGVLISPELATVNGEKSPTQNDAVKFLFAMFSAYEKEYDDLSDLPSAVDLQKSQKEINLSNTYSEDTLGISLNYPDDWVILEPDNQFQIVKIIDSKNKANSVAMFSVNNSLDENPYGVFTNDETAIQKTFNNEYMKFLKFENVLIGDVPAKSITYQMSGLKEDDIGDIAKCYWYVIKDEVYEIRCSYSISKADVYEPIFNAIIDSYIIRPNNSKDNLSNDKINYDTNDYNEYILPDSDKRYITANDIENLSDDELRLARNEIYARHGRIFESEDLKNYFSSKSWYKPSITADNFNENLLNQYEKANINFIVNKNSSEQQSDDSALAGHYTGYSYELSISIYSTPPNSSEIGNADLTCIGEEPEHGEIIKIDSNNYILQLSNNTLYLTKSVENGVIHLSLDGEERNVDTFVMDEHYQS